MVSVVDFLTPADQALHAAGVLFDATYAFNDAQQASLAVDVPTGLYGLVAFRPRSGLWLRGVATRASVLKQIDPEQPVFEVRSDSVVGQLLSLNISGFRIFGADVYNDADSFAAFIAGGGEPVAIVRLYADANWAITNSYFEYFAQNTYGALIMQGLSANNIYDNRFVITGEGHRGTAAVTGGPYNNYDLFLTQCDGYCIIDTSSDSDINIVGENCMRFAGQRNTIKPRLEGIVVAQAAARTGIVDINHNNTYIDPLVNLFSFDVGKLDFAFQSFTGSIWINPQVVGEGARSPLYPFGNAYGPLTVVGGRSLAAKIEDYHNSPAGNDQRRFDNFTLVGRNDGMSNWAPPTAHKVITSTSNVVEVLDPSWETIEVSSTLNPLPHFQLDMVAEPPMPGRKLLIVTTPAITNLVFAGGSWGDVSDLPTSLPENGVLHAIYCQSTNKWLTL